MYPPPLTDKPFSDPLHQSFFLQGDKDAALLLHGFPGTPAEMRPLGLLLKDQGWTVHAPLLPGFGPEIQSLAERNYREWLDAALTAYAELHREYARVLLIGYSMGGALAIQLAVMHPPGGLVLLAPFTRFAVWWQELLWPIARSTIKDFKPFQHADFSAPEIRRLVRRMCNGAPPTDSNIQEFVRGITVPTHAIDQVKQLGRLAYGSAAKLNGPILLLQGRSDAIVDPRSTRRLRSHLTSAVDYFELDSAHDLVEPDGSAWPEVRHHISQFAAKVKSSIC